MPRRPNPEYSRAWKLHVPASIAGVVEHKLWDDINGRPHYAARGKLLNALLLLWIAREEGKPEPNLPTREELLTS